MVTSLINTHHFHPAPLNSFLWIMCICDYWSVGRVAAVNWPILFFKFCFDCIVRRVATKLFKASTKSTRWTGDRLSNRGLRRTAARPLLAQPTVKCPRCSSWRTPWPASTSASRPTRAKSLISPERIGTTVPSPGHSAMPCLLSTAKTGTFSSGIVKPMWVLWRERWTINTTVKVISSHLAGYHLFNG